MATSIPIANSEAVMMTEQLLKTNTNVKKCAHVVACSVSSDVEISQLNEVN